MSRLLKQSGTLAAVAALAALMPGAASASTIEIGTAGCSGASCSLLYPGGTLTLTPVGGSLQTKTLNGETGLGVSNGTSGEIDVNEAIDGAFSSDVTLDAFRILFIYNGPEFGDPNEVAQVTVNGSTAGTLTVNGENTAVWSLPGASVSNCGDTTAAGTGCFLVTNPFGNTAVSNIAFTALHSATGTAPITSDSDYSLSRVDVTPVPEPASLMLFGMGIAATTRRLRRRA
jgi:hypothetical protein